MLLISTPVFARQTIEAVKVETAAGTAHTTESTPVNARKDQPKKAAETLTAANFRVPPPKNQKFREAETTVPAKQTPTDDGTMMGVMGEGGRPS